VRIEQSFTVRAPLDQVWSAISDVGGVAACLPGAELGDAAGDGTFAGTFAVKMGAATASYRGTLQVESLDAAERTATMRASGRDQRGQGSAKAVIVSRVTADANGARVDVDTDFTATGRLARFGRGGMMEDIAARLLRDFASCLERRLAPDA
jgi:carbon monoxide dehydrogenase subunit G